LFKKIREIACWLSNSRWEEWSMKIEELLRLMVDRGASDLHLRVARPPTLRIDGALQIVEGVSNITPSYLRGALEHVTNENQRQNFYNELELDLAYSIPGVARFRINAFMQRDTISMAFRRVPFVVPTIEELGLPSICKSLALKPRGLVLLTGRTGTGKSTTLAAIIDHINKNESRNIITIEDPIEYVFQDDKSMIAQRDLGSDTKSFGNALRHVLRQDPDVILVGEMRDLETIATAITAAETGHLVLSTLHTPSAPQAVDRIIDVFPPHQQEQIRLQLSLVLEGVLSQVLLRRASGRGRVAAVEIMLGTDAVRNIIRESKIEQMPTYMQTGSQFGMQTMDQALQNLVKSHVVTAEEALPFCTKPSELLRAWPASSL
jgi:twitching motility protein PilT